MNRSKLLRKRLSYLNLNRGLISYYPLDGDVQDYAGNNDGSIIGDPQFVQGINGQALKFDGVGDGVDIGQINLTEFSISTNIKFDTNTDEGQIITADDDDGAGIRHFQFRISDVRTIQLIWFDVNDNVVQIASSKINEGQWYHIVAKHDGDKGYIYIDGTEDASAAGTIKNRDAYITMGYRRASLDHINATIDESYIYNRGIAKDVIQYLNNNP